MVKNPVVFWELATHDQEKTVKFFREVFEWEINFNERLGFYIVPDTFSPEPMEGGIFTLKRARLPFVALYIQVEHIEEMEKKVIAAGGWIVDPVKDIGGGTKLCLFNEPSGVIFAMIEPAAKAA
jgi:predicted enzyme related to lactoylglutathione lyase